MLLLALRGKKPLLERNADMIQSMLAVWSHHANKNWCMIGYHLVSVIAVLKGNAPFDANKALDACVTTARNKSYDGLGYYIQLGYVPEDKSSSLVSKPLEYAHDDWCIAQMAQKLDRPFLKHQDIMSGGELVFLMAGKP